MLPKSRRLAKQREIQKSLKCRQYQRKCPLLYYVGHENGLSCSRLCVVTSRRLGSATVRNRIKRVFFRAFDKIMHNNAKKCVDMVIYPRLSAISIGANEIAMVLWAELVKDHIC